MGRKRTAQKNLRRSKQGKKAKPPVEEDASPFDDSDIVRRLDDDEILISSQIWTPIEEGILKDSIRDYRATEYEHKGEFVQKNVAARIKKLDIAKFGAAAYKPGGEKFNEWKAKKKRIYNYMMNHGRIPRGVKLPGMNKKWTFISVLRDLRKDDIYAEAKRLSINAPSKKTPWLGHYQQARINIQQSLTADEKKSIEDMVKLWNKGYVPAKVQTKMAKANAKKVITEMNRRNFLTMGMRTLTLACHMDEDGKMQFYMNDTESLKLDDPRVPSFKIFDPTGLKFMEASYLKYVKHVHKILNTARGATPPPDQVVYNGLTYHPTGLPKFPDEILNRNGVETNVAQRGAIRDYLNKHYELATGKKAVPYGALARSITRGEVIITAEHWPPGVEFKEPSSLTTSESNSIVRFWRRRQSARQIPFRFDKVIEGSVCVAAVYPDDIFDIYDSAAALDPPKKQPKQKKRKATMRDPLDSDGDSEHVSSSEEILLSNDDEDDEEEDISPEEEEGAEEPPPSRIATPSVVNSSLVSDETRIDEGSQRPKSGSLPLPRESDWGDAPNATSGTEDIPIEDTDNAPHGPIGGGNKGTEDIPIEDTGNAPHGPIGGGNKLAPSHTKGKRKANSKVEDRSAAAPRTTRSQIAKNAPLVEGTRSKTKARGKT